MKIQSNLSQKEYLSAMQDQMSGHFEFGAERFTGFFIGSFFYVTYHSGYEWNRRYTNQKNAAMGFVKKTESGCEARFMRFRGALCPLVFLPLLLTMLIVSPFIGGYNDGMELSVKLLIALVTTVICAPIITLFESLTKRSDEGRRTLLSFLMDPTDPYANYHRIP